MNADIDQNHPKSPNDQAEPREPEIFVNSKLQGQTKDKTRVGSSDWLGVGFFVPTLFTLKETNIIWKIPFVSSN